MNIEMVKIRMQRVQHLQYSGRVYTPQDLVEMVEPIFRDADREQFVVVGLNGNNHPTMINLVAIGSLDAAVIHPRELFKPLILCNSAGFICVHNHPGGDPKPSPADISITRRIYSAAKLMGMTFVDHIILGLDNSITSMKREGFIG